MSNRNIRKKIPSGVRAKLRTAISMLLISSIMMAGSTYAWLVLSTAPEVTGITTQVGANGSLEIALLSTESYNNLALLDAGDFDESVIASVTNANLTWGNLISLGDPSYGMDKIILQPSRLNISKDGEGYKVSATSLLKTPKYGDDGRIIGLNTIAQSAVCEESRFPLPSGRQTYGLRVIGTPSSQSEAQLAIMDARNVIFLATSGARSAATAALNETGGALGNIVVKYALGSGSTYTKEDIEAMRDLALGLEAALDQIKTALQSIFAAFLSSDKFTPPTGWDKEAALSEVYTKTPSELYELYGATGIANIGIDQLETYISKYTSEETKVANAIVQCDTMLASGDSFTWDQIVSTMNPLVDYTKMTMNGYTISQVKQMEMNDLVNLMSSGGITITVPSGSGIISDVADFAGNYTATVVVDNVNYGSFSGLSVTVLMTTRTTENPVYLNVCSSAMAKLTASTAAAGNAITNFYGYAIDLAFRTNAETGSHLLLQTEPENRVYQGSDSNPGLQGGGSYMEYEMSVHISATKMIKLMSAIRVVFMDKEQNVLAIGALDTTLGQDRYHVLTEPEKEAMGTDKYAVLQTGLGDPQISDCITKAEFDLLPAKSEVLFDPALKTIKAKLFLYNFHMTVSNVQQPDGSYGLTGGITLDGKKTGDDADVLATLTQSEGKIVTALVYLDGSFVYNSMVSADSAYSMTGKLNLQFASDAYLMPAQNYELENGSSD